MDYLEPQGFLGTGASLLADLTLLAYILLIVPGMIVGYVFARQGKHRPHHKWAMIIITVVNWLLIFFLMIAAYRFDVAGNIADPATGAKLIEATVAAFGGQHGIRYDEFFVCITHEAHCALMLVIIMIHECFKHGGCENEIEDVLSLCNSSRYCPSGNICRRRRFG